MRLTYPQRLKMSLLILFILTLIGLSFYSGKTLAANAVPDPPVPCTDQPGGWEDPEFNSGRPYQATPCRGAPYASMCGNNITVVVDHVKTPWDASRCTEQSCKYHDPSTQEKRVVIDLSGVKLPILGNTQDVTNSQNPNDNFDDAQKVNEYVAWYLNGVNQKAEYGEDTEDKTVNYSGPAKKLLPSAIQEFHRFESLHNAGVKPEYTDPDTGETSEETLNHNQIVVCTKQNFLGLNVSGIFFWPDWLGTERPQKCYEGVNNKAKQKSYRLLDWWESKAVGLIESKELLTGWIPYVQEWKFHVPPFPWQFTKDVYYQKAYNEWRGKKCILLPIVDTLTCADIYLTGLIDVKSNVWSNFYQYIPLSNTVDKKGKEFFDNVHVSAPKAEIERHQENSSIDATLIESVPKLFYPHTLETVEASRNLNQTYLPKTGVEEKSLAPRTEDTVSACQILDVRTNPGDDLTFDNTKEKHQIDFTVYYKVTEVDCTKKEKEIKNPAYDPILNPNVPKFITVTTYSCESDIYAQLDLTTMAPYLNDIWTSTTAGSGSTFRMIFPKVEEGAPISCVADIPGVSPATYTLNPASDDTVSDLKVKNPGGSTATTPEIYFPHLGTVYEYFLKGIQTALRPQGMGSPLVNGKSCTPAVSCGDWESKLGGSGGACGICNAPIGNLAKRILTAAGTAYNVPASNIWAAMKHEGADGYMGTTYDFSDANVRKWSNSASCGGEPMPGCDNNIASTQPPFGFLSYWFYLGDGDNALWRAVQKIDPSRNTKGKVSRCNFLDAAFAAAKLLAQGASNTVAGTSCGPYSGFNTIGPGTCSRAFWTDSKVAQSQTGYAGYCVLGPLYTIDQAVGWEKAASCQ